MSRELRVTRNLNQTPDTCENRRLVSDRPTRAPAVRRFAVPPLEDDGLIHLAMRLARLRRRVDHASPWHSPLRPP
jgi:hypothetical protein